ncbi:MAG: YebC/PmpR family DNA-binding transcriptional regulator, partial [Planctomycetota bacterium]
GNPDMNLPLKYAVDKARAANMTNDSIKRAIQKGTGELSATNFEDVLYEGYAHGGIALMCTGLTDNRARTAGEVKNIFDKRGGSVGAQGSVAWQFSKKAIVRGETADTAEDDIMMAAMEAGAEDLFYDEEIFSVVGPPESLAALRDAVEGMGLKVTESEITWEPNTTIEVADKDAARKILKLIDTLEDNDDVQSVVANYDIPEAILAELAEE